VHHGARPSWLWIGHEAVTAEPGEYLAVR